MAVVEAPDRLAEERARMAERAELETRIRARAARISAEQAPLLQDLARYDELEGWKDHGARSIEDWLSNHCGHALQLAKAEVKLAHALEQLPHIQAAMASGALSFDKARALAAVASPETEEELLRLGLETTANQLNRALGAVRRALDSAAGVRLRQKRYLDTWWDDDGMLIVRGKLTPEEGGLFRKALAAAKELLYRENRSAGFEDDPPAEGEPDERPDPAADADDPHGARQADALVAMAESYLATSPVSSTDSDNYLVMVHVDADLLMDDGDGRCHLEFGPALPTETARRLACGASLVWLATDKRGDPVAISDKTQDIPTSVRRAVRARDNGCVFPVGNGGRCGMSAEYCDVHHAIHRADGGAHTKTNCWTLCRFHHHQVHEGGFKMTLADDASPEFRRPDGRLIRKQPDPPPDPSEFPPTPQLEPDVSWARSNGERMNLGMVVDGLLDLGRDRATNREKSDLGPSDGGVGSE